MLRRFGTSAPDRIVIDALYIGIANGEGIMDRTKKKGEIEEILSEEETLSPGT